MTALPRSRTAFAAAIACALAALLGFRPAEPAPWAAPAAASDPLPGEDSSGPFLLCGLEALLEEAQALLEDCLDNGGCTDEEIAYYVALIDEILERKEERA